LLYETPEDRAREWRAGQWYARRFGFHVVTMPPRWFFDFSVVNDRFELVEILEVKFRTRSVGEYGSYFIPDRKAELLERSVINSSVDAVVCNVWKDAVGILRLPKPYTKMTGGRFDRGKADAQKAMRDYNIRHFDIFRRGRSTP
jgi:hypothetical protein